MQLGIRAKLLLWLVLVILPIAAASSFAVKVIDARISERIGADLENTRRLEAARIADVLKSYQHVAESLAENRHVTQFVGDLVSQRARRLPETTVIGGIDGFEVIDPDQSAPLQQLVESLQGEAALQGSEVVELMLLDTAAQPLGATAGFTWQPEDPTLIERVLKSGDSEFGDAFRNPAGADRLGIVAPVFDRDHSVVAVMLLEARLGPVVNLVAKHEGFGATSEAHIVQRTPAGDARFITPLRFSRGAAFTRIVPKAKASTANRSLASPHGAVELGKDYRGERSVLAYETLPLTGWGLVVKVDAAEAFAPVAEVRSVIVLASLVTMAIVVLGWMAFLHPIAIRLQKASRAAERVANGEFLMPLDDCKADEIGDMSRSIDSLAADLDADIRMRAIVEERLHYQAMHDELTGLFNRKHANQVIRQLDATGQAGRVSILFLDLDGFKHINDRYGHAAGDEVLVTVARRLGAVVRQEDTLARWGGDEFVVILPDSLPQQIDELARRIRCLFAESVMTSFGRHLLGCSIGLASAGTDQSLAHVLATADERMYAEKRTRSPDSIPPSTVTNEVQLALEEDRLDVWYQPILETGGASGKTLIGAEALVRLRNRHGGIVTPGEFLDDIRNRAISRDLDRCVLNTALAALARWRRCGMVDKDFRLSVNMIGQTLRDPGLFCEVRDSLERYAVPATALILEVSERAETIDELMLLRLRMLGVHIALDDVGMHHSNLDRLVRLQPDSVKIDRNWLRDPSGSPDGDLFGHNNQHTRIVLPKLIDICRLMGLSITAEGVESASQFEMMHELGVTVIQGYLFDRPRPGTHFIARWGAHGVHTVLEPMEHLSLAS